MKRITALCLALLLAGAGFGCARKEPERSAPPAPATQVATAVFFGDKQAQHLIPEERLIDPGPLEAQATEVVRLLLDGPLDPHLSRTMPPGVQLLEPVEVANGVAKVNLSAALLQVRGAAAVNLALGSLRLSLTELGSIERVAVLVDGQRGAVLDEGFVLDEPLARPFYGDIPVLPDPDRVRYLQERVDQGEQPWRTDPIQVLELEGRMFGFTGQQLQAAEWSTASDVAEARIRHGGTIYLITLARNTEAATNGIWTITAIASHRAEAGAVTQAIYFADRQYVNVIPELRALPGDDRLPTAVVEALLAGPTDRYLARTLPAGTRLKGPVKVEEGVARVNLSSEFTRLQGSAESGRAIDALVYTLTEIPSIQAVQILVDGQEGAVVSNYKLDQPMGRGPISEQYYPDPERVAWLQERVNQNQESWRLDPFQTLMWEGRAFGFTADFLKTARLEEQVDRALARLTHQGKGYVIELGRNPGDQGIWFVKGMTVQ